MRPKEFVINRAKNWGDIEFLIEAVENGEEWVLKEPEARQLVVDAMRGKRPRKRDRWRDIEKSRMIAEAYYYKRNIEGIALYAKGKSSKDDGKDDACDMVAKRRAESRKEYTVSADTVIKAIQDATEDEIHWAIEFHADEWPHDIPDDEIRFVKKIPLT
jgi:hypothetical protein